MALTKESVFNKYINTISVEREQRLIGLKKVDTRAEYLWKEALNTVSIEEKNELINAYDYANKIIYDHPGLSSQIYFTHPLRVASYAVLLSEGNVVEAGIIGLLHNVLEVSSISPDKIEHQFGKNISHMISTLTVDRNLQWDIYYKKEYYSSINRLNISARKVKIIDKLDNLFTLGLNPEVEVRLKYLNEIKTYIVPMVKRDLPYTYSYFLSLISNHEQTEKILK
jgi:guanosine-3',5'-bis(diphosphate) 3'-pyrophosphohydrolase